MASGGVSAGSEDDSPYFGVSAELTAAAAGLLDAAPPPVAATTTTPAPRPQIDSYSG